MAKITNAFTTYSATGNREDLSNAIYNIDPFDTPVMSAIRRRNVKNRIFDWQIENLPAAAPAYPTAGYNAQFEGFALSPGLAQPTIRQNNVTQISEREPKSVRCRRCGARSRAPPRRRGPARRAG